MGEFRHHRAVRDVQVVLVPVPVGGSPEPLRTVKPGKYPQQGRAPWRPATTPPSNRSKGEAAKRLLDAIARSDEAARAFMAAARRQTV